MACCNIGTSAARLGKASVSVVVSVGVSVEASNRSTAASVCFGARWEYRTVMAMVLCPGSSWTVRMSPRHHQPTGKRVPETVPGKTLQLGVPPSARRLAGEPQTAAFRPSPNTPSKASLPPQREEVSPMCPVRSVTYVSVRSQPMNLRCMNLPVAEQIIRATGNTEFRLPN